MPGAVAPRAVPPWTVAPRTVAPRTVAPPARAPASAPTAELPPCPRFPKPARRSQLRKFVPLPRLEEFSRRCPARRNPSRRRRTRPQRSFHRSSGPSAAKGSSAAWAAPVVPWRRNLLAGLRRGYTLGFGGGLVLLWKCGQRDALGLGAERAVGVAREISRNGDHHAVHAGPGVPARRTGLRLAGLGWLGREDIWIPSRGPKEGVWTERRQAPPGRRARPPRCSVGRYPRKPSKERTDRLPGRESKVIAREKKDGKIPTQRRLLSLHVSYMIRNLSGRRGKHKAHRLSCQEEGRENTPAPASLRYRPHRRSRGYARPARAVGPPP